MTNLLARVQVILGAAVTYLVALGAVLAIVVDELAPFADEPAVAWIVRILGIVATIAGVSVAIVRRVTPVIPAERGLLPPPPPRPITEAQADAGAVDTRTLAIVAVVVAVIALLLILL